MCESSHTCEWVESHVCVSHDIRDVSVTCLMELAHCNTLQHIATRCNTLLHTETPGNTWEHMGTHGYTLQHAATRIYSLMDKTVRGLDGVHSLQHTATHTYRPLNKAVRGLDYGCSKVQRARVSPLWP